jgi:FtsZ-binding cell division protein ZapB
MRLNINLASQKYADARQFYLRWGAAVAAMVVLAIVLGVRVQSLHSSLKRSQKHIVELKEKIDAKQNEQRQAEAMLNQPGNHDVREQKSFWNETFDLKSLSWTSLFMDLEKIMPNRAYVVSIAPSTFEHRLRLKMLIAGEKYENADELLKKMEESEHFRGPVLEGESVITAPGKGTIIQFAISTYYTPANRIQQSSPGLKEGM